MDNTTITGSHQVDGLPRKHKVKIDTISDERHNHEGFWIYLTGYRNIADEPTIPLHTIHEQSISAAISKLREAVPCLCAQCYSQYYQIDIRKIQPGDIYKFLPTSEISPYWKESDLAWEVLNPDNYVGYRIKPKNNGVAPADGSMVFQKDGYTNPLESVSEHIAASHRQIATAFIDSLTKDEAGKMYEYYGRSAVDMRRDITSRMDSYYILENKGDASAWQSIAEWMTYKIITLITS